jgi:hypothetical protein
MRAITRAIGWKNARVTVIIIMEGDVRSSVGFGGTIYPPPYDDPDGDPLSADRTGASLQIRS